MEVRLTCRWGSYLQGSIISVSVPRAKALVEAGFGKYVNPPVVEQKTEKKKSK